MTIKDRVLVVEDEKSISGLIKAILTANGYDVITASTGNEAFSMISSHCPDLVVLDLGLPDMDGMEIIKAVRSWTSLPIIVVSARSYERDKVQALDMGADDYVTKPFSMKVLFARIAAMLRKRDVSDVASAFSVGAHSVDGKTMRVTGRDGSSEPLASREYELLRLLYERRGEVLQRDWLLNRLWGVTFYGNTRTLDQHIALIRRKLGGDAGRIETVRNVGYRLRADRVRL